MKTEKYFKLFLLTIIITFVNLIVFIHFLNIQIVRNSSYIPYEIIPISLIIIAIPFQFAILVLISNIFKNNNFALAITSLFFGGTCYYLLWTTSKYEREEYNAIQVYKKYERFDYSLGISTPEGYPIKLIESEFKTKAKGDSGVTYYISNGVFSNNWGNGTNDKSSSFGNDFGGFVVPDSLELYWYSFVENKYYHLNTKINKNKITQYFRKGYDHNYSGKLDTVTKTTYKELVVGITPGGDVVIWVSSMRNQKEIEVFKAREIEKGKLKNIKYVVKEEDRIKVLNDTSKYGGIFQLRKIIHNNIPIPYGVWTNKYRKLYNWKIVVNDFGQTKSAMEFDFFNAEKHTLYNESFTKMKYQKSVLPNYLNYYFMKNNKKYSFEAFMEFDEDEIYDIFEKLTTNNPDEPLEFKIEISEKIDKISIQLRSKDKSYYFKKMTTLEIRE